MESIPGTSKSFSKILLDLLSDFRDLGMFCDVLLECGSEKFKAHKVVLAAFSPLFKTFFSSRDFGHPSNLSVVVPVKDPNNMRLILKFLYSGVLDPTLIADTDMLLADAESLRIPLLELYIKDIILMKSSPLKVHQEKVQSHSAECNTEVKCQYRIDEMTVEDSTDISQQPPKQRKRIRRQRHPSNPLRRYVCPICGVTSAKELKLNHFEECLSKMEDNTSLSDEVKDIISEALVLDKDHDKRSGILRCNLCLHRLRYTPGMLRHKLTMHSDVRLYQCPVCFKAFKYFPELAQHEKFCKAKGSHAFTALRSKSSLILPRSRTGCYKCHHCPYRSASKGTVIRHLKMHQIDYPLSCKQCCKRFKLMSSLIRHQKMHEGQHCCMKCQQVCRSRLSLAQHMWSTHGLVRVRYRCWKAHCQFAARTPTHLFEHLADMHRLHGRHRCYMCTCSFPDMKSLLKHRREIHMKFQYSHDVQYVCSICGNFRSNSLEEVVKHSQLEHPGCKQPKKLILVNRKLKDPSEKKQSLPNASDITEKATDSTPATKKYFLCTKCNQLFPERKDIEEHVQTAHGMKPEVCVPPVKPQEADVKKCPWCDFETTQESRFRYHKMKHTGKFPRMCEICGYKAQWLSTLQRHYRTHQQPKDYTCELCGKSFNSQSGLRTHQLKHKGTPPYKCPCCVAAFFSSAQHISHMFSHAGIKPYACSICKFECQTSKGLQGHYKSSHGIVRTNIYPRYELLDFKIPKRRPNVQRIGEVKLEVPRPQPQVEQISDASSLEASLPDSFTELTAPDLINTTDVKEIPTLLSDSMDMGMDSSSVAYASQELETIDPTKVVLGLAGTSSSLSQQFITLNDSSVMPLSLQSDPPKFVLIATSNLNQQSTP